MAAFSISKVGPMWCATAASEKAFVLKSPSHDNQIHFTFSPPRHLYYELMKAIYLDNYVNVKKK